MQPSGVDKYKTSDLPLKPSHFPCAIASSLRWKKSFISEDTSQRTDDSNDKWHVFVLWCDLFLEEREHRGAAGGGLGTETIMIVLQWYTVWRSRSGDGVESTSLFSFEDQNAYSEIHIGISHHRLFQ